MSEEKRRLRAEVLELLKALPVDTVLEKSKRIEERLFEGEWWRRAREVYCFVSMPREVQTAEVCRRAIEEGKVLALPRVAGDDICFHRMGEPDRPLVRSRFGIDEPPADLPSIAPGGGEPGPGSGAGAAAEGALVIVPGLAFDLDRYRLGRGRGYYDRFLAACPRSAMTVGVCFEEQLVEHVPRDDWDVRIDRVITDERVISG
ncbi:MAG: 5-formyltetrahydrofolate cyclo-ligase [Spirochaetaceae bacterium]